VEVKYSSLSPICKSVFSMHILNLHKCSFKLCSYIILLDALKVVGARLERLEV
jgi:hypothetical protein